MVQHVSIDIKTHKHIKAYLENNFGKPVHFSRNSIFLNKMILCLTHDRYRNYKDIAEFEYDLKISVPLDTYYRYGCYMNLRQEQLINLFIDKLMKIQFTSHVDTHLELSEKKSLTKAIYYALDHLKITEEDWNFDCVKRYYHRYRTENNLPLLKIQPKKISKTFGKNDPNNNNKILTLFS